MTYEQTLQFLYSSLPAYEHSGATAYKPGLGTSLALDDYLGRPHQAYKTIHVAGTNGKGSVCHLLAAILQQQGFKVGLYTSPHLVDFRERIRVNGEKIPEDYVTNFILRNRVFFEPLLPSFFEMTSSMAFAYFRAENVDYAIIETGLGGRLDSTNIITPVMSVITNISMDHMQFLGDTPEKIAFEKAGIIKPNVPVVIGENDNPKVSAVFIQKAKDLNAPICFASDSDVVKEMKLEKGHWMLQSTDFGMIEDELGGEAQERNAVTVLQALRVLARSQEIKISSRAVVEGFRHVVEQTGLMGRWQTLQEKPLVIADTGHNTGGWKYNGKQLQAMIDKGMRIHLVVGMMADKDIEGVLKLMPKDATYIFTAASTPRAMHADQFASLAARQGLKGTIVPSVKEAVGRAMAETKSDEMIFIGGSTYVVAEAFPLFQTEQV